MASITRRTLGGVVLATPALAQPARPIVIIVPFPPGGSTVVTARLLAERMAPLLSQQVPIEKRPGAQTIIGAEYVARAKPDAHTLLMSSGTTLTINPLIGRNLPYKVEDFAPVAHVATLPFAVAVRNGLPSGMADFFAHIRANPGRINWGAQWAWQLQPHRRRSDRRAARAALEGRALSRGRTAVERRDRRDARCHAGGRRIRDCG